MFGRKKGSLRAKIEYDHQYRWTVQIQRFGGVVWSEWDYYARHSLEPAKLNPNYNIVAYAPSTLETQPLGYRGEFGTREDAERAACTMMESIREWERTHGPLKSEPTVVYEEDCCADKVDSRPTLTGIPLDSRSLF